MTAPRKFGAIRDPASRSYLLSAGLSMLGDNNEHVITYWVLWETFHSPALVGFQVVSHWLPFLMFSVPFGALAERFDCRKIVGIAQALFAFVSICWGVLFATGTLEVWHACVLLVLHGCAGALWAPAEQLLLHDYAPAAELPGMIRLNATFRGLGQISGPIVGSALLFGLGPEAGIFANVLFYVPMTIVMLRTRVTGHDDARAKITSPPSLRDLGAVFGSLRRDRTLLAMLLMGAFGGLLLGGNLQAAMPSISSSLGVGDGIGYSMLLFANGAGGVLGGLALEASGRVRPTVATSAVALVLVGITTALVAWSGIYLLVLVALFVGGVGSLAANTAQQALVQLRAPAEQRGRIVGVFNMVSQGLRTVNGLTIAVVGGWVGVVNAVGLGAVALAVATLLLVVLLRLGGDTRKAT